MNAAAHSAGRACYPTRDAARAAARREVRAGLGPDGGGRPVWYPPSPRRRHAGIEALRSLMTFGSDPETQADYRLVRGGDR